MTFKPCPLCQRRRPRRDCPALGRTICAVCCGTKRQVEINCPPDCPYLSSARAHPAATVVRRRERDFRFLLPIMQELTDTQYRLLLALQALILKHAGSVLPAPIDQDVGDAAGSFARTLETASRGIIYEHQPSSLPAQRLVNEMRDLVGQMQREAGGRRVEADALVALRRIEQGAREAAAAFPDDGDRAYLGLLGRMMSDLSDAATSGASSTAGPDRPEPLIIPGR